MAWISQAAQAELRRLAEEAATEGSGLTARRVLDAARSRNNPLHKRFEWRNTVAAEKYRLMQAQHLIRVAVVQLVPEAPRVRYFVSLAGDRGTGFGYRTITTTVSDGVLRARLMAQARRELGTFRTKYRDLTELARVMDAIDIALAGGEIEAEA